MEEIKNRIIKQLENKKTKTITFSEIRNNLKLPYNPENDKVLSNALEQLVEEKRIEPLKSSKKNIQRSYEKYRIIKNKEEQKEIQKEIINTFQKELNPNYFLKNPEEYVKTKEIIIPINNFFKNPDANILTINERSYQIFKNEKKLKENEDIISKLGLNFEKLHCYETYEPFFCYINSQFKRAEKKTIIVENKDTFWTIQNAIKQSANEKIYMVIYGEGKKILQSFKYIENFAINKQDEIQYFGDIDYEGINIYVTLKQRYPEYNIIAYKTGYEIILDLEPNPPQIRKKQNSNFNNVKVFLEEFEPKYQEKLKDIFNNKKYIPQEVFNSIIAQKLINI